MNDAAVNALERENQRLLKRVVDLDRSVADAKSLIADLRDRIDTLDRTKLSNAEGVVEERHIRWGQGAGAVRATRIGIHDKANNFGPHKITTVEKALAYLFDNSGGVWPHGVTVNYIPFASSLTAWGTSALYRDPATGFIGLFNTSPDSPLTAQANGSTPVAHLTSSLHAGSAELRFSSLLNPDPAALARATIRATVDWCGNRGKLIFATADVDGVLTDAVTISSLQNVGIGAEPNATDRLCIYRGDDHSYASIETIAFNKEAGLLLRRSDDPVYSVEWKFCIGGATTDLRIGAGSTWVTVNAHTGEFALTTVNVKTTEATDFLTLGPSNVIQKRPLSDIGAGVFEPVITAGTNLQYWRGDKTWQTLNTAAVPELTNLYYTDARARAAISATSPIAYNSGTGTISHSSAAGNKHIPSGGAAGNFLKWSANGTAAWAAHGLTHTDVGAAAVSHTHAWADLTSGVPATATRWPTWDEVTGKPSTFTPSTHFHDDRYLQLTGGTVSGPLSIANNMLQFSAGYGLLFGTSATQIYESSGEILFRANSMNRLSLTTSEVLALPEGGPKGANGAPAGRYPLRLYESYGWNFTLQSIANSAFRIQPATSVTYTDPSYFLVSSTGNVGIGTTPTHRLHVAQSLTCTPTTGTGHLLVQNTSTTTGNVAAILFQTHEGTPGTRAQISAGLDVCGNSGFFAVATRHWDGGFFEALRIDSYQRFGVRMQPAAGFTFSVAGDSIFAETSALIKRIELMTHIPRISLINNAVEYARISGDGTKSWLFGTLELSASGSELNCKRGTNSFWISMGNNVGSPAYLTTNVASPIAFSTNSIERMRITETGDVQSTGFTKYTSSAVVGMGNPPAIKEIYYKYIGKLCWCWFYILSPYLGASGDTVSFTLPVGRSSTYDSDAATTFSYARAAASAIMSRGEINTSGVVTLFFDAAGSVWSGSTRAVRGQFCYQMA